MNASSSRENLLDSTGRKAVVEARNASHSSRRLERLDALKTVRTAIASLAVGVAIAVSAGATRGQDQEYVVGDLPEAIAGPDNAIVGLPLDIPLAEPLASPFAEPFSVPEGGAESAAVDGDFIADESGASEVVISDGWMPLLGGGDPARNPRWTAQIDALFLFMGNVPNRTLYIDDVTGQPALGVNDAPPAMSAAPRYSLTWHRDESRAFELNYFAVGAFKGVGERIAPDGTTFSSVGLGGVPFNDVVAAGLETTSGIKSWEFNLRRTNGGPVTWIAGFRWVEWTQQLFAGDVFVDASGLPGFDAYATSTGNNLYGGQLGADMMLWNRGERIRINGVAKGGVYYNYQSYQRSEIYSDSAILNATTGTTKDTVSFVGEVGLVGEYRLTNWLSWRAGYTLFWIEGIATPANQLANTVVDPAQVPRASISPYGGVFLHGVNTGLEARW